MYYSCDDQFGPDKDSDNEQGMEVESFNNNVVQNTNGNTRQRAEGLFLLLTLYYYCTCGSV